MKTELTQQEYNQLPPSVKDHYYGVTMLFDGRNWVEARFFDVDSMCKLKTVYKLYIPSSFGGHGIGTF